MRAKLRLTKRLYVLSAIILLVMLPLWLLLVVPSLTRLPNNFAYSAEIFSRDNFYDQQAGRYNGAQTSNTRFYYESKKRDSQNIDVKNVFDVKTPEGKQIIRLERNYGVNRSTGQHVAGLGDKARDGYLFAPKNLQPNQNYRYWHINYDVPADMQYQGEEYILGLKVYHYRAKLFADQTNNLSSLPGVPQKYGINLDVDLQTWIEPTTGRMIKYQDDTIAYYYDQQTKQRVFPWNHFANTYTESSIADQVERAHGELNKLTLVKIVVPITLLLIGVGILAYVLLGAKLASLSPWLVLVLGLVLTFISFGLSIRSESAAEQSSLNRRTELVSQAITQRLRDYEGILRGAQGLFAASNEVERDEWKKYVVSLDINSRLPGVQGVGFSQKIGDTSQLAKHIASVRAQGFPGYNITPEGNRAEYHSIVYIEPFNERNQRAFGYDMFQEPMRRSAMERARDTGEPSLSGKVRLKQETDVDVQSGFLMYLPVYKNNVPVNTPDSRRTALVGYVYSPFRMTDFATNLLSSISEDLPIEIYDKDPSPENLMYRSVHATDQNLSLSKTVTIDVAGERWTIRLQADSGRLAANVNAKWIVLIIGLTITGLLFVVILSLRRTNSRALALAAGMTSDLRKSRESALAAARRSQEAEELAAESASQLEKRNKTLEETKQAILNVLDDLHKEKAKVDAEQVKSNALFESIDDGIIVTDEEGRVRRANSAALNLLGCSEDGLIGQLYAQAIIAEGEAGKKISSKDRLITQALLSGVHASGKGLYRAKSGRLFPVAVTVAPFLLQGKPVGAVEVFRDVTQERILDRAKDEFVAVASHQLRTPATAVKQFIGMMLEGYTGRLTHEQKETLQLAYDSNERQINISQDLLNVAKLESGNLTLAKQDTNITELITMVAAEQELALKVRKQKLKLILPIETITLPLDAALIRMVIDNLLSNASKYSDDGKTISVKLDQDAGHVKIMVQDEGVGIAKADQAKLFEKFSRINNRLSQTVTTNGLGLYIARQIVDLHQGTISVESRAGKGSLFTVQLPKGE